MESQIWIIIRKLIFPGRKTDLTTEKHPLWSWISTFLKRFTFEKVTIQRIANNSATCNNGSSHLLTWCNCFILITVTVDLEPILGTLGVRWEYTLASAGLSQLGPVYLSQTAYCNLSGRSKATKEETYSTYNTYLDIKSRNTEIAEISVVQHLIH